MNFIEKLTINGETYTIRDPQVQQLLQRVEELEKKISQEG